MADAGLLERRFPIRERGSTVRTEVLGGVATFLTMSYILVVNPSILAVAGLPFEAVAVGTALVAAVMTALMGLATGYPFALASGLGLNAIVAFDIVLGREVSWQVGMACVVIEGVIALVLVLAGVREAVVRAVPNSLKLAIGVGIGLFITLVGLRNAGIVVNNPATGIGLGNLTAGPPLIALAGIAVAAVLAARNIRGSILLGVVTATVLGLIFGVLSGPDRVLDVPGSAEFTIFGEALSGDALSGALTLALIPVIFALFMTDFFDTIGTAVGLGTAGGFVDERGELPNTKRLLLVDSAGAAVGGVAGVSSVTTYVESGAGIAEGARTGLASLVTAGLFLLAIPFVPLLAVIGQAVPFGEEGATITPAVAPALVMVGFLMIRLVRGIEWERPEQGIPAFFVIAGTPLTFSIAAGIGLGVLAHLLVLTAMGRARDIHPLMWPVGVLFALFFAEPWLAENVF
jgi:adenine/guanine/hypoxanthine permease